MYGEIIDNFCVQYWLNHPIINLIDLLVSLNTVIQNNLEIFFKILYRFLFLLQHGGQRYHIKLEIENGILHQKLIFSQSIEEMYVELHECVIFNDGTKSPGCSRPEYKNYVSVLLLSIKSSGLSANSVDC